MSPLEVARAALQAYVDKDRPALESLLAEDFRFTSPLDHGLDRAAYLRICWPNSDSMRAAEVMHGAEEGERAFIVYEAEAAGKRFRNAEMHVVRDGRLASVEVYFGWNVPHPVPAGTHVAAERPPAAGR